MLIKLKGKLELGTDAIGTGDENRLPVFAGELEKRAEATDAGEDFGAHGALGCRFDTLDKTVTGVDIDTSITIGQGCIQLEFLGRDG
jgi:hypothetical protein